MTTRKLKALANRYMLLLGMDEWLRYADVGFVRDLKDCDGEELVGQSWWHPEERISAIRIMRGMPERKTHETLIHELLHVLLEGHKQVPGPDEYDETYELGLNRMARAYFDAWNGE